ncbi:ABC transporter substrate-binding protein [Jiangella sp. DSM 45060]|uniref:ABC transporter substrate-binding protein n=1 Tax=Jiangella sp. DSM 45060 TaxID=1798224 RepID=UPI0012FD2DAA|nr:sugar ABC transporter substrate-binding protein [Jiangella sp. DSM 45060]
MVAGLTLFLAGCGGDDANEAASGDPDSVEGKVVFWTYPIGTTGEDSYWAPVVDRFNEEYPDVEVEVIVQPFQGREEQLTTSLAGGEAPDVVYFNPDFIPRFVEEGFLEPVADVIEDDVDDFRQAGLDAMTYDGELYGVPWLMGVNSMICITTVLEAAGVECPKTWDDALAIAPAVKGAGYYLTQYEGAIEVTLNGTFYQQLRTAGGEVLNEDMTEAAFNGPEGVRALEILRELAENEYVPQQSLTVLEPFEQTAAGLGEVAFMPYSGLAAVSNIVDPATLEVGPPIEDAAQSTNGTVGGLSIFNTSENIPAAKAWIDFLTSEAEMESFLTTAGGYHSPRASITGLFADNPKLAAQEEYLDLVWPGLLHPQAREIMDLISPHVQAAILGRVEPQAALDAAADEVNGLLDRG